MTGTESLRQNLAQVLLLPAPAVEWLLMLWNAIQVFDDVADGDPVDRAELDGAIWNTLVAMNQNSFYLKNAELLAPCVALMVMKWQASDRVERAGEADARSYMWRAGYYDVILVAVQAYHGAKFANDNAHVVMELYGETFEDYMKEFGHA
jgi:hypothetical protein